MEDNVHQYLVDITSSLQSERINVIDYGAVGDGVADDSSALNAAAAALIAKGGGILIMPPGTYLCSANEFSIAMDADTIFILSAYGAEITTEGAISGIKLTGAFSMAPRRISGLRVNHRGNSSALYGFNLEGVWNTRLKDCTVVAHGVSATYGAFRVGNSDPANDATGSFWTVIEDCWVRKLNGADVGEITNGIILEGSANATRIYRGGLNNVITGVTIRNQSGNTTIPDSVQINDLAIETYTTGISLSSTVATSVILGPTIIGCRAEKGTTFFSVTGITQQPNRPPVLIGNDLVAPLTTYVNNPNDLFMSLFDVSIVPSTEGKSMTWKNATKIVGNGAVNDPLTLVAGGGNVGLSILESTGVKKVISIVWSGTGNGAQISANTGGVANLQMRGVKGISGSGSSSYSENLRGSVTFASSSTVSVTFGTAEPDASYFIAISADKNETFWVTGKATTGFTINSSNASSVATIDWILIR